MKLNSFSFLADENIPQDLVDYLHSLNLNVKSVVEENLIAADDAIILQRAHHENRIVITQDADFGRLIFTTAFEFTGVIFLRPGHLEISFHKQTLEYIFKQDLEVESPFILVAENTTSTIKLRLRNQIRG